MVVAGQRLLRARHWCPGGSFPTSYTAGGPLGTIPSSVAGLIRAGATRHSALSFVGTVISRRRILPVGPFGRLSTNQTRRGYL